MAPRDCDPPRPRHRSHDCAILLTLAAAFTPQAQAGGMDTHMSATYALARQANLTRGEAALLARANWSMDLNEATSALPPYTPGEIRKSRGEPTIPSGRWYQRGEQYHSLGDSPDQVRERLQTLHAAVAQQQRVSRDAEMRAAGQYLHALQDVYFHQGSEPKPYGSAAGHLSTVHDADNVALHFDAALRAFEVTGEVLRALSNHQTMPPVPPVNELYRRDPDTKLQVGREELRRLATSSPRSATMLFAQAIARAYETGAGRVRRAGEWNFDAEKMNAGLERAWRALGHDEPLEPLPPMAAGSPMALDYDQHPDLLAVPPRAIAPPVGGIALSRAVANSIALDLDLDAIRIDDGAVVFSGAERDGGMSSFDAALFLTTLRLACERDDPSFSLDPANGAEWLAESRAAMSEAAESLAPVLAQRFVDPAPYDIEQGIAAHRNNGGSGVFLDGPTILVEAARNLDPQVWAEIQRRHPHLGSRLVFRPEWLRGTRVGKILFDADLLLKELASGISIETPERGAPALAVEGYRSAEHDRIARHTLAQLEGRAGVDTSSARLWFELPHPPPGQSIFTLPELPPSPVLDELFAAGGDARTLADVVRERLRVEGFLEAQVDAALGRTIVPSRGGTLDLSEVWPQVFVRAIDLATRTDLPGREPSYDALAARVNQRVPAYAAQYRALGELAAVLRAYLAATRLTSRDQRLCSDLVTLPLFDAELLATPLPAEAEGLLVLSLLRLDAWRGTSEKQKGLVGLSSYYGGVSLAAKGMAESAFVERDTGVTRAVVDAAAAWRTQPARWSANTRRFITVKLDLGERAAEARRDLFEPVTMEDIAAIERGETRAAKQAPGANRRRLVRWLSSRWTSVWATLLISALGWSLLVVAIRWATRPGAPRNGGAA